MAPQGGRGGRGIERGQRLRFLHFDVRGMESVGRRSREFVFIFGCQLLRLKL